MPRNMQYRNIDERIINTFLKLLHQKPFEKITVQNILEGAKINRATFYNHYEDKYQLLDSIQKLYLDEMVYLADQIMSDESIDLDVIDEIMAHYFDEKRDILRTLLKIRTSYGDVVKSWCEFFRSVYFPLVFKNLRYSLNELDMYLLTNIYVDYILYYLEHEELRFCFSEAYRNSLMKVVCALHCLNDEQEPERLSDYLKERLLGNGITA